MQICILTVIYIKENDKDLVSDVYKMLKENEEKYNDKQIIGLQYQLIKTVARKNSFPKNYLEIDLIPDYIRSSIDLEQIINNNISGLDTLNDFYKKVLNIINSSGKLHELIFNNGGEKEQEQEQEKEKEKEKENININLDEFIKSSVNDINNVSSGTIVNNDKLTEVDPFVNDNDNDNDTNNDNNDLPEKIKGISDSENISLEIEDLDLDVDKDLEVNEDPNLLKEVSFNSSLVNSLDTFTLKKPNQVYQDILNKAREKAREAKKQALQAYLELKEIKKTYMIDNIDDSDSDSELDAYSDEDDEHEDEDDEH
jgi:hypothetical protein